MFVGRYDRRVRSHLNRESNGLSKNIKWISQGTIWLATFRRLTFLGITTFRAFNDGNDWSLAQQVHLGT